MSLLPLLRGDAAEWRRYIHGKHASENRANHYITTGKIKYVWFSADGREQLFDLIDDPCESHNLIDYAPRQWDVQYCRAMLIKELTGREEGYTDGRRLIPGRPSQKCLERPGRGEQDQSI